MLLSTDNIYLDHNATAPLRPQARAAMLEVLAGLGNPSSVHRHGREQFGRLRRAREQVAAYMSTDSGSVVFTSGGTESNNLALGGAETVLCSGADHDSVRTLPNARASIPVLPSGLVCLQGFEAVLKKSGLKSCTRSSKVVALLAANNETGVLQPMDELIDMAHHHGWRVHVDAVQFCAHHRLMPWVGRVDSIALSGHKLGAAQGVGALICPGGVLPSGQMVGGGQEYGARGGTGNLAGIAGLGAALEAGDDERDGGGDDEGVGLRDGMEQAICAAVPEVMIAGAEAPRLWNTSCLILPGVSAQLQVMHLDLAGFSVSSGAACSSGKVKPSHVLEAMGVPHAHAIRVSLGASNTAQEVAAFVEAYSAMAKTMANTMTTTATPAAHQAP